MPDQKHVFEYYNYPIVPIKFSYKDQKTPSIEALLDSGGDFIVIPMPIAKYLGLKLKKAGIVDTAGGATKLFKANLTLQIGEKNKVDTYSDLQIHVSGRDDIPVLLGRYPIFEDYEITFKKQKNELTLQPMKERK